MPIRSSECLEGRGSYLGFVHRVQGLLELFRHHYLSLDGLLQLGQDEPNLRHHSLQTLNFLL